LTLLSKLPVTDNTLYDEEDILCKDSNNQITSKYPISPDQEPKNPFSKVNDNFSQDSEDINTLTNLEEKDSKVNLNNKNNIISKVINNKENVKPERYNRKSIIPSLHPYRNNVGFKLTPCLLCKNSQIKLYCGFCSQCFDLIVKENIRYNINEQFLQDISFYEKKKSGLTSLESKIEKIEIQESKTSKKILRQMIGIQVINKITDEFKKSICRMCCTEIEVQHNTKVNLSCGCCICSSKCLAEYFKTIFQEKKQKESNIIFK